MDPVKYFRLNESSGNNHPEIGKLRKLHKTYEQFMKYFPRIAGCSVFFLCLCITCVLLSIFPVSIYSLYKIRHMEYPPEKCGYYSACEYSQYNNHTCKISYINSDMEMNSCYYPLSSGFTLEECRRISDQYTRPNESNIGCPIGRCNYAGDKTITILCWIGMIMGFIIYLLFIGFFCANMFR